MSYLNERIEEVKRQGFLKKTIPLLVECQAEMARLTAEIDLARDVLEDVGISRDKPTIALGISLLVSSMNRAAADKDSRVGELTNRLTLAEKVIERLLDTMKRLGSPKPMDEITTPGSPLYWEAK